MTVVLWPKKMLLSTLKIPQGLCYFTLTLGCKDLEEFYQRSSCVHVLDKIKIPMIFVNASDDPIVPPPLLEIIKRAAGELFTVCSIYSWQKKFKGIC